MRRSSRAASAMTIGLVTVVIVGLLVWAYRALGPQSVVFALFVVWLPMVWLGIVSRFVRPRLPRGYHRLRRFERSGRVYELVGVRVAKRALRRGPLASFNPDLHLPSEPNPERIAHLDQRMRDAEASHAILFALTILLVVNAAAHGWLLTAGATLVFDVLLNGYPVMLQRYNRRLLAAPLPDGAARVLTRYRHHTTTVRCARDRARRSARFLMPCRWSRDITKSAGTMPIHPPTVSHHGDVVHRDRNR